MPESDLKAALDNGDLAAVRSLLDAGADVRYVRPEGYTVMIDAMFGCGIKHEARLFPIMRLLIERGADLDAVNDHGHSAISLASNGERFDVVKMLLDAGANPVPLKWTPLMRAVALGTVAEVQSRIESGADLTVRDRWDRTAWLLCLLTGDIAKAELLLTAGAKLTDRGSHGRTALTYPIRNDHAAMVRWLLAQGADPNEKDDNGNTALIEAAGNGNAEFVQLLLDAGADLHHNSTFYSAIQVAGSVEVVRVLVQAGADLNDINDEMRAALTQLPRDESVACTLAEYQDARHRVYGTANPQRMNFPYWKAMVAGGANAYRARMHFEQDIVHDDVVWCFDRFGKSINELPDGRIVEIAGEHEDFYDPDFCIYNDVIVHRGDGTFDIYGYPKAVFPPTDFHTATLVDNFIYIIGSLGYPGERRHGTTPVYRLDTDTLVIEAVETTGVPPGWISRHKAKLIGNGIEVAGGKVCNFSGDKERYEDNPNTHILDLATGSWSCVLEG